MFTKSVTPAKYDTSMTKHFFAEQNHFTRTLIYILLRMLFFTRESVYIYKFDNYAYKVKLQFNPSLTTDCCAMYIYIYMHTYIGSRAVHHTPLGVRWARRFSQQVLQHCTPRPEATQVTDEQRVANPLEVWRERHERRQLHVVRPTYQHGEREVRLARGCERRPQAIGGGAADGHLACGSGRRGLVCE